MAKLRQRFKERQDRLKERQDRLKERQGIPAWMSTARIIPSDENEIELILSYFSYHLCIFFVALFTCMFFY